MNEYIEKIANAIVDMDEDNILSYIDEALAAGVSEDDIYNVALSQGMLRVTHLFEEEEYYVSEVIVCADTLNMAINYGGRSEIVKAFNKRVNTRWNQTARRLLSVLLKGICTR